MAGTWSAVSFRTGSLLGKDSPLIGVVKSYTADADDGTVPQGEIVANVSALLTGVEVVLDPEDTPDAVTVELTTIDGIVVATSPALTASAAVEVSPPFDICGDYMLNVANTGNGAKATIICKFRN